MWAARSWNRIWKKQGLPERAYEILEIKFKEQIDSFDSIASNIFRHGSGAPDGFDQKAKIRALRKEINGIFEPGANAETLKGAYDLTDLTWREFSSAFVASNVQAKSSPDYSFEQQYQAAMDALKSYGTFDSVKGLVTFC